jgi:hypothetical protein
MAYLCELFTIAFFANPSPSQHGNTPMKQAQSVFALHYAMAYFIQKGASPSFLK